MEEKDKKQESKLSWIKKWFFKYRVIIIFSIIVILIPIVLNVIMSRNAVFDFVGQDTDWLVFWGTYLGGVLTVIFGVCGIHIEIKFHEQRNRDENDIKSLKIEIEKLKTMRMEIFKIMRNDVELIDIESVNCLIESYLKGYCSKQFTKESLLKQKIDCYNRKKSCTQIKNDDIEEYEEKLCICIDFVCTEIDFILTLIDKNNKEKCVEEWKERKLHQKDDIWNDLRKCSASVISNLDDEISNEENKIEKIK